MKKGRGNMQALWKPLILLFCVCSIQTLYAGEEATAQPAATGEQAIDKAVADAPGLRMDPILLGVGMEFMGGADIGNVFPAGAVSSAEEGYVVQEYKVLDANAATLGVFYRVRTLLGNPVRDVAVMFDKEGKLQNIYDLQPPTIDEEATKKAKTAAEKTEKPKGDEEQNFETIRFKSIPSSAVLGMMIGMEAAPEAMALEALLKGVVRASNLSSGQGVSGEDVKPKDPAAFKVTSVLPKKGTAAPKFSYKTLSGKAISNATVQGKPYAVFVTSLKTLQGITSEDALARRSSVMMSRVSRWMFDNKAKTAVQKRMLVVMADKEEDIAKTQDGDKETTEGMLVADPEALATFGITVSPMLLFFDGKGALIEAFSATSPAADYLKALEAMAK